MSVRRRNRFRVTLLTLCALLLAQWTLVTHACPTIHVAGHLAAQLQAVEGGGPHPVTGCGGHGDASDDGRASGGSTVCAKHCADERSASGGSISLGAGVAAPAPLALRVPIPDAAMPALRPQSPAPGDATTPPLSILYCVSLT